MNAVNHPHCLIKNPHERKLVPHRNWKRIGRLKAQSSGAGQHYHIEVDADEAGKNATAIRWEQRPVAGSKLTHPGVYCLRSNQTDWSAETMWRTYLMLTDLEAVFRSLKSELGLRPIFHQKQHRSNGHLFITVLAYQLVQVIRRRLREQGEHSSWDTLRSILGGQQRVTCSFLRDDGSTLPLQPTTAGPVLRSSASFRASDHLGRTQVTLHQRPSLSIDADQPIGQC